MHKSSQKKTAHHKTKLSINKPPKLTTTKQSRAKTTLPIKNQTRSFFSQRSKSIQPSLDIPFGLEEPPSGDFFQNDTKNDDKNKHKNIPLITPHPVITTLPNGLKVVTHNRKAFPVSHISLSVGVGSRHEDIDQGEGGITNFMERSILRSTTNRVTGVLIRDMAKLGCDISTSSTREHFVISATTPTRINPVLGAIADIISYPEFETSELQLDKSLYLHDSHLRAANERDVLMNELIHGCAYGGVGLGQSLYAKEHDLINFTQKKMKNWHKRFFTPKNMVLAGVNVNHDEFVALAEEMFRHLPEGGDGESDAMLSLSSSSLSSSSTSSSSLPSPQFTRHTTHYTRKEQQGGLTQLALYWEGPSIQQTSEVVSSLLLRQILGRGSPSSQGGPGKGMQSRLHRVVQENTWIPLLDSFTTSYSDSGMFGIYGLCGSEAVDYYLDMVRDEVLLLHETLNSDDLMFGREALRRQVYTQMGSDLNYCETLARHVQLFNHSHHLEDFMTHLDHITLDHIKDVSRQMFQGEEAKPGLVTLGEPSRFLPRDIRTEFNLVIRDGDENGDLVTDSDDNNQDGTDINDESEEGAGRSDDDYSNDEENRDSNDHKEKGLN